MTRCLGCHAKDTRIYELEIENETLRNKLEDLEGQYDFFTFLTPTENFIVDALMNASPRTMSLTTLNALVEDQNMREASPSTRKVQILNIRKKLAKYGIEIKFVYYHGYCIDAASKKRLLQLMQGEIAA